jgi:hypothetical protein
MPRLLILSLFILFTCCKKTNPTPTFSGTGTLTGSDTTCGGWLILTSDITQLEPHNLDSFPVIRKDGLHVTFTYYKTQEAQMICQLGQPINLISITEP